MGLYFIVRWILLSIVGWGETACVDVGGAISLHKRILLGQDQ